MCSAKKDRERRSTVDQLREEIDRGRTGDKVEGSDPAAVPLGTDEEAAGTPLSATAVERARAQELASTAHPPQHQPGLGAAWILVTFASVLLVGLVAWEVARIW